MYIVTFHEFFQWTGKSKWRGHQEHPKLSRSAILHVQSWHSLPSGRSVFFQAFPYLIHLSTKSTLSHNSNPQAQFIVHFLYLSQVTRRSISPIFGRGSLWRHPRVCWLPLGHVYAKLSSVGIRYLEASLDDGASMGDITLMSGVHVWSKHKSNWLWLKFVT